jgi:lipopolysaccharide exporter
MSDGPRFSLTELFSTRGFRGPVLTLLSGSAVALSVSYLAQPILTRLYSPEAFGIADYFIGLMTVLIAVASLRYEDALMTPDTRREAGDVWWLCLLLTILISAMLALLGFFRNEIAAVVGSPLFGPFVWLIAPALLVMRISRLGDLWLARERRFRIVSGGDVANKLSMTGIRLGASSHAAGGLIGGFVAGHLVSASVYASVIVRSRSVPRMPPLRRLLQTARRFRRYPLFSMPSALLNAVVARLPILLLPVFFTFDVVGQFGRAFIVLAVPLGVIGGAISQVFFVASAEARREGRLPRLAGDVHGRLVALGMFPTVALMLAGPELFAFVLGDPWMEAGFYVRYLGPWLFLGGIAAPLTRVFDVLERQRADLATAVLMFTVLLAAMVYGGQTGDVMLTIMLIGIAGTAARLAQIVVSMKLAGVSISDVARPYLRYGMMSIPALILIALTLPYEKPLATFFAAVAGGLAYGLIVLMADKPFTSTTGASKSENRPER